MAILSVRNVKLSGISACVPRHVVKNMDDGRMPEDDRKILVKTIGVAERRIASASTATSDLCFVAAEKLIADLGWKKDEIEALIFVSQSGDYQLPATAPILQHRLGLSKNCLAFDIGLGCSGYVYGLSVLASLLSSGSIKKALLLAGDKSSLRMSPKDKSTYPLFGDAGSATALEYRESCPEMIFNLQSDGSGYESIIIPDGLGRNPIAENSLKYVEIEEGIERRPIDLILRGTEIFDFALREVIPAIKETLAAAGKEMEAINYFLLHQANLLINETLRKMMKLPLEKVPYSIHRFGNTSSASIPLTIVTELQSPVTTKSLKLLICGFGVGLSWGTAVIKTDTIVCPSLIEYND